MDIALIAALVIGTSGLGGVLLFGMKNGQKIFLKSQGAKIQAKIVEKSGLSNVVYNFHDLQTKTEFTNNISVPMKEFDALEVGGTIEIAYQKDSPINNFPVAAIDGYVKKMTMLSRIMLFEVVVVAPAVYFIMKNFV